MDLQRLTRQLALDEGRRIRVYTDHLGYKTVGIGHLIKDTDPEEIRNLEVGDKITEEQLNELFSQDVALAIKDAEIIFEGVWDEFPDMAQEIFINMIFNLGRTRFMKFKKTIYAAYQKDWKTVSEEMLDSKWARQVSTRAHRLSAYMARL